MGYSTEYLQIKALAGTITSVSDADNAFQYSLEALEDHIERTLIEQRQIYLRFLIFSILATSFFILLLAFLSIRERAKRETLRIKMNEREIIHRVISRREENLRVTMDSITDGVITIDKDDLVTRMNRAACKLTEWSEEDALGKNINGILQLKSNLTNRPFESYREKRKDEEKYYLVSRKGNLFTVDKTVSPLRMGHENGQDESQGYVIAIRDISSEDALRERLSQSQKMDAIGQLAGGVAHDFNNMLAGIMGASELLEARIIHDKEAREYNGYILQASQRAAELTRNLLAYSRKQKLTLSPIDMIKVTEESVSLLERTIDRRININFIRPSFSLYINGNYSQIQSIFLNLGINASHAIVGGGSITISLNKTELDKKYCRRSSFDLIPGQFLDISIKDTGSGIPEELQSRIFDPFFTTKEVGEGTGLGLSAVLGTVQQHNGAIEISSTMGEGSCFRLLFPLYNT